MLSYIGKRLWNLGAALFWSGILLIIIINSFGFLLSTACSTDEYEELYSPNGELRAVVVMSGCGGFSSPQTQIYVERIKNKSWSPLSLKKTNTLIRLDGKPEAVNYKIEWRTDDEFVISDFDFSKMMEFTNHSWGTELPRVYFKTNGR